MGIALEARTVLRDARRALSMWEDVPDEDGETGRVLYAATFTLLRAVNDVLREIDARTSQTVSHAIGSVYRAAIADPTQLKILESLKSERNEIVHHYRFAAEHVHGIPLVVEGPDGELLAENLPIASYFFDEGPFAGEDARDIARDIAEFWEERLREIELRC